MKTEKLQERVEMLERAVRYCRESITQARQLMPLGTQKRVAWMEQSARLLHDVDEALSEVAS